MVSSPSSDRLGPGRDTAQSRIRRFGTLGRPQAAVWKGVLATQTLGKRREEVFSVDSVIQLAREAELHASGASVAPIRAGDTHPGRMNSG